MTRWFPRLMVITMAVQFVVYGVRPLISYQALSLGAGPAALGVITASFSVLSLLSAVPLGRGVDRWGETPFIVAGSGATALVCLALLLPGNLVTLGLCSAVLGLGHLGTVVGAQTLIAKGNLAGRRDVRFATFTSLNSVGQLLGPAVTGLLIGNVVASAGAPGDVANDERVLLTSAIVGMVGLAAAVSLWLVPAALARRPPVVAAVGRGTLARVFAVPSMPTAMLSSLTVLSSIDLLAAYLPAYGEANGIPVRTVGFLLATQGVALLLSRIAMLRLIALLTRRRLLALSMLTAAAGLASVPFLDSVPALYVAMVVTGFGLGLGQPITLAWVAAQAPIDIRGTAMSVRLTGNRLGQTVVPVLVGGIAGGAGLAAAFVSPAVLLALAGALVMRSRPDPAGQTGPAVG